MNCRDARWCAHPRLRSGEALSSWLHRFAQANGVADHTFCRQILRERPAWNRDIDRYADASVLESAAAMTGERLDRLKDSVLRAAEGKLFATHTQRGELPWVLPLGIYHRLRRRFGQQFCPRCISEPQPWLRLAWRFAWSTVCTVHGIRLLDRCPTCGAPFMFHRMQLISLLGLRCTVCGSTLAAPRVLATQSVVRFQKRLERAYFRGSVVIGGELISALDLFVGLRSIARALNSRKNSTGLCEMLPKWLREQRPQEHGTGLEHWRSDSRHWAMEALRRCLDLWPDEFVSEAILHRIYRFRFDDSVASPQPAWLEQVLLRLERPVDCLRSR